MQGHDWGAIRQKYPLSQIAGEVVDLKKKGRELIGLCPFHQEKTPSFRVNEERETYKCFGCGATGDVVDFVSQYNKIDAAQAVAKLTGNQPPRLTEEDRVARKEWEEKREADHQLARQQAIIQANRRWNNAHKLDGSNAYLEAKGGIAPHQARIENGNLLIPVHDKDGSLINVQSIADDGSKRFQKDAPMKGGRLNIGIYMGRTIICEGFATGASIFDANSDQVCIAFNMDNMETIARELSEAGASIVLAADTGVAADRMRALAQELDCPVAIPVNGMIMPNGKTGTDFNDQAQIHGKDSIRASFAEAYLNYQLKPEAPLPPPHCDIEFIPAFDFNEADIPLRPWIVPGILLRGYTHMNAAPGGTGKSLFWLQMAIALSRGQPWGKWHPKRPMNVLIINAEDDIDEQRRRLSAARTVMGVPVTEKLSGLMIANNPSSILVSVMNDKKRLIPAPLVDQLQAVIKHYAIDVIIVDPFTETFEGDENSNDDAKWAMKIWRNDIARACNVAVQLIHHTTKNSADKAGTADAIRGAGALVNSVRIATTLFNMSTDEAEMLGVTPEERHRYVKFDDAKMNQGLAGSRQWFKKISVVIGNGGDEEGDEVGALEPVDLSPAVSQPAFNHSSDFLMRFVQTVNDGYVSETGVPTDEPFLLHGKGGTQRAVVKLIERYFNTTSDAARKTLDELLKNGILLAYDWNNENKGRLEKAVKGDIGHKLVIG